MFFVFHSELKKWPISQSTVNSTAYASIVFFCLPMHAVQGDWPHTIAVQHLESFHICYWALRSKWKWRNSDTDTWPIEQVPLKCKPNGNLQLTSGSKWSPKQPRRTTGWWRMDMYSTAWRKWAGCTLDCMKATANHAATQSCTWKAHMEHILHMYPGTVGLVWCLLSILQEWHATRCQIQQQSRVLCWHPYRSLRQGHVGSVQLLCHTSQSHSIAVL